VIEGDNYPELVALAFLSQRCEAFRDSLRPTDCGVPGHAPTRNAIHPTSLISAR